MREGLACVLLENLISEQIDVLGLSIWCSGSGVWDYTLRAAWNIPTSGFEHNSGVGSNR